MTKEESTILKGIAIIFMYIHHLFGDLTTLETMNVSPWVISTNTLFMLGITSKICVAVFVFISAYGITLNFNISNLSYSIKKRFLNLYFPLP